MTIEFDGQNNKLGTTTADSVTIKTNDTDAITVDSSQKIGIGTSSPSELLEVNGNIRVGVGSQTAPSLQIGDNDTGIFDAGANAIGFTTAGTEKVRIVSGGSVAIGATSASQKLHVEGSIYTSGSLYVGGTGSANALDDYEEGTFTPLVEGTTTSGSATYTTRVAKYTKVGNIVHFSIFIRWQSGSGTGPIIITGLPFTSVSSSYHSAVTIGWMNDYDYTNGKIPTAYIASNVSRVSFEESTDNGNSTNLTYDSQAGLILSGSYETT